MVENLFGDGEYFGAATLQDSVTPADTFEFVMDLLNNNGYIGTNANNAI